MKNKSVKKPEELTADSVSGELSEPEATKLPVPSFDFCLIVKSPFKKYSKGMRITDPFEIQRIVACHEKEMVIKSATNSTQTANSLKAIIPYGSANLAGQGIPNVIVQIQPPQPQFNGVSTDIIASVGTATYGPVNSAKNLAFSQYVGLFGLPQPQKYDMGTPIFAANLNGATNFICVRVTDGTDVASSVALLDSLMSPAEGALLTSIYTGSTGNTINAVISVGTSYTPSIPTYKLSIYLQNGIPEVFDNIGGSGATFWVNLVNAVNNGQSTFRGPSQIVIASLYTGISSVTIGAPGSYTTAPTVSANIGTGATFAPHLYLLAPPTLTSGGTSYSPGDVLTLVGGTFSTAAQITVDTVSGGVIATFTVSRPGVYTALPSSPASVTGGGTGATFTCAFGLLNIAVTAPGSDYTAATVLTISGAGGGAATANVGSVSSPAQSSYVFSGGTDGNGVTDADLIGDGAVIPRTGMFALMGTKAAVIVLADQDDPTYFTDQVAYTLNNGLPYMIGTIAPGYQDNIDGATAILQAAGIDTPYFKLSHGDWDQINDPFNSQTRYISPQGFMAGVIASQLPSNSSLNKEMVGIVATQKTAESRIYSDTELYQLKTGRLEVITKPIPLSQSAFGCRLGINTSSNPLTNQDNYPRMIYFLGQTIAQGMGPFVGLDQTPDTQLDAKNAISAFLTNIWGLGMIGYASNAEQVPFSVILDGTNNPQDRVALGFMQANVTVVLLSIVQQIIVNLDANQNSIIQAAAPTQLLLAA